MSRDILKGAYSAKTLFVITCLMISRLIPGNAMGTPQKRWNHAIEFIHVVCPHEKQQLGYQRVFRG